ncbi:hypothetical protein HAZT_HAZT004783 [Hyalella azteca]|uniref:Uncharacterized protein n=1 Tax=Hyalella azteca TaxID=294128 RepID=A0A6A0H1V0_HYAAZ|nr:hypothetical protein HAZT_HAZT004783 [Hyalella azteca]
MSYFAWVIQGVILRDEIVWQMVRQQRALPLVMLTSGGYQRSTAAVIAESITNLQQLGLVDLNCGTTTKPQHYDASNIDSSMLPPLKYSSLLTRCTGKKKSSVVSASESSTPQSGRHSATDSTTSSPPPHGRMNQAVDKIVDDKVTVAPGKITSTPSQDNGNSAAAGLPHPPSFIDIKAEVRNSLVSACSSADYSTPHFTVPPSFLASPSSPPDNLRRDMTQQMSISDSTTPPSPVYRSVTGSWLTVNNTGSPKADSTPPLHRHDRVASTPSLAQQSCVASLQSPYQSAHSITSSLAKNCDFMPP